jgi:hypothetical protein
MLDAILTHTPMMENTKLANSIQSDCMGIRKEEGCLCSGLGSPR